MFLIIGEDNEFSWAEELNDVLMDIWLDGCCDIVRFEDGRFQSMQPGDDPGDETRWVEVDYNDWHELKDTE
jgi:hypothetical protein